MTDEEVLDALDFATPCAASHGTPDNLCQAAATVNVHEHCDDCNAEQVTPLCATDSITYHVQMATAPLRGMVSTCRQCGGHRVRHECEAIVH